LLIQFGGERRQACVAMSRMRSLPIVIFNPGCDLDAGMSKTEEQRPVEQLVAHPAV
jgi:hypothetical protein|tara:strand:- start:3997 stop:4164 length:168 start_codon:yes stop_codon:yes gene_type:complete